MHFLSPPLHRGHFFSPIFFAPIPNNPPPPYSSTYPFLSHLCVFPSIVQPVRPVSLQVGHSTSPVPLQQSHRFLVSPPCTRDPSGSPPRPRPLANVAVFLRPCRTRAVSTTKRVGRVTEDIIVVTRRALWIRNYAPLILFGFNFTTRRSTTIERHHRDRIESSSCVRWIRCARGYRRTERAAGAREGEGELSFVFS